MSAESIVSAFYRYIGRTRADLAALAASVPIRDLTREGTRLEYEAQLDRLLDAGELVEREDGSICPAVACVA